MLPIRLGLLSTANINGALLGAREDAAPFSIEAVGSRDGGRARAYASEHGIPRAHASYDELIADPNLDAVYIALPNALHHEWTMRALAAGKHVLCEKPYTRFSDEAEEACDEAAQRGLVLAEAYMWRHASQTRLLLDLLPRIGEVRSVTAVFTATLGRAHDPRWDANLGGGALLDLGCYCISAARLILGEPDLVHGEATRNRNGVDEHFTGILRFGDVRATFHCGLTSALVNRIEVIGADGVLEAPSPFVEPPGVVVLDGEQHRVEANNHYRAELDDFCAAVRGERTVLIGRAEMLGQARVLQALAVSSRGS